MLDRLKGYERVYQTKLTDGERTAYGRGPTRDASLRAAQLNWCSLEVSDQAWDEHPEADI
jgi:hypothetical protein